MKKDFKVNVFFDENGQDICEIVENYLLLFPSFGDENIMGDVNGGV